MLISYRDWMASLSISYVPTFVTIATCIFYAIQTINVGILLSTSEGFGDPCVVTGSFIGYVTGTVLALIVSYYIPYIFTDFLIFPWVGFINFIIFPWAGLVLGAFFKIKHNKYHNLQFLAPGV